MTKVLIVEDEPMVARMYQKGLEINGYQVFAAVGGIKGIEIAKKEKPDVILMDIMMPGMTGVEALTEMKKDPEIAQIPVIMLTNMSADDDKEICMHKGAKDYLVKSQFKPRELSDKLKEILNLSG
jgi:two-component system, OmpR family, alkaline phosphatase synthesis response regulator PhoP